MAARIYELDQQRDAQLAFNAAQTDATKLKGAVDDLAEQQRLQARKISTDAGGQIRSAQFILIVLSIAAVLGAALVAWLYVGRSAAAPYRPAQRGHAPYRRWRPKCRYSR